jgi:hypothetical protein
VSEFALLVRPRADLSPEDVVLRGEAVRAWAVDQRARGVLQSVVRLEDPVVLVGADGSVTRPDADAVASVMTVEAADLDAAIALVRGFAGLAWGTAVEIRAVALRLGPTS